MVLMKIPSIKYQNYANNNILFILFVYTFAAINNEHVKLDKNKLNNLV